MATTTYPPSLSLEQNPTAAITEDSSPVATALTTLKSAHFRLPSYGPDFLEFFANKYMTLKRDKTDRKLNVVAGPKAEKLYRKFIRNSTLDEPTSSNSSSPSSTKPVVFAFTFSEAGKKSVKFYKTWRDHLKKQSGNPEPEEPPNAISEHRLGFLDSEFDRVMGFLDSEFKRMSATSNISVTSLPFLRSVPLDTSRSEQDSSRRVLKPTNPDSSTVSIIDTLPGPSGFQRPTVPPIDTSAGALRALNPDITVSSPETAVDLRTPTAPNPGGSNATTHEARPTSANQVRHKAVSSRKKRSRSKRARTSENSGGASTTDASSEAGRSSASRSSGLTRGSSSTSPEDGSAFTIVLLEDGKDYFVDRRHERKHSSKKKSKSRREGTTWWGHEGELPPSRPPTPRPFNPCTDDIPDDVTLWWAREAEVPDKYEGRSAHPDAGTTTWKKYMEPVGYPLRTAYDQDPAVMSLLREGPMSEYLPPVAYPTPSVFSPYASPNAVLYTPPHVLGYYSGYSGPIALPDPSPRALFASPIYTDNTGYPYGPG